VRINEIMYHNADGCRDYIELYNPGPHAASLHRWTIADGDAQGWTSPDSIGTRGYVLMENAYCVVTRRSRSFASCYPPWRGDMLIACDAFPEFGATGDGVFLLSPNNRVVDNVFYTDDMQFELLPSSTGIALERLHWSLPSTDRTTWHSAAEDAGYCTPGYLNSQHLPQTEATTALMHIEHDIVSPDNDGYQDVLAIQYTMPEANCVGTCTIHTSEGYTLRTLAPPTLLGTNGMFAWDGLADDGSVAPPDIYIAVMRVFSPGGRVYTDRKPIAVAPPRH
jgi:Lamin Tail Domain